MKKIKEYKRFALIRLKKYIYFRLVNYTIIRKENKLCVIIKKYIHITFDLKRSNILFFKCFLNSCM